MPLYKSLKYTIPIPILQAATKQMFLFSLQLTAKKPCPGSFKPGTWLSVLIIYGSVKITLFSFFSPLQHLPSYLPSGNVPGSDIIQ